MNPLIGLAISLVPELLQLFAGDKTGQIGKKIAAAVADVTKTSSSEEAAKKVYDDPKIKADLQIQLAQIALAAQKATYEDAQRERDAAYKADVLANVSTAGARQAAKDRDASNPLLAFTPAILSYIVVGGFLILLGMMAVGQVKADTLKDNNVTQIFNILIGALAAAFATVMNFWLGSSLGSSRKGVALEQAAKSQQSGDGGKLPGSGSGPQDDDRPPPPPPVTGHGAEPETGQEPSSSKTDGPARHDLLSEIIPKLTKPHRQDPNGVAWALTPDGIAIDGVNARGTPGEPSEVRKIWENYGPFCQISARAHGVPVELIVATIAVESSGGANQARPEPRHNDQSVGLMQTLVKTAGDALGRPISAQNLLDPATSINAGTAYIAEQRSSTHFDPPLVAAAYNAGSLQRDPAPANRWKLRCFPLGTGHHIDKFVAKFGDCMKVSAADDWSAKNTVPSFAAELSGRTSGPVTEHPGTTTGPVTEHPGELQAHRMDPNFPPPPPFPALSDSRREALFGKFTLVADPQPGNPEAIKITDNWERDNIVAVRIPFVNETEVHRIFGKPPPIEMRFHTKAKQQLIDLWLEWEKEGLLENVLTFDGAFIARFMRPPPSPPTKLSNHAFGTAFDINASFNPRGDPPAFVGQRGSVRELVQIANKHGFYWGGHFHKRLDGMHFEVAELMPAAVALAPGTSA